MPPDYTQLFKAKKYDDKQLGSLPPINQAINRSVGNSFDKSNPQGSTQYGQGQYNSNPLPTKQLKPISPMPKISTAQVQALENDPSSLAKPYQLSRNDLSFNSAVKEAQGANAQDFMWKGSKFPANQGNVRIYDDGRVEQLGGVAKESMAVSRPGREAVVDVSNQTHLTVPRGAAEVAPEFADILGDEDVSAMPDFMETASLGGGLPSPPDAKGFLSDEDLMATIQPEKLGELPPAMKALKARDFSGTMPDMSSKMGMVDVVAPPGQATLAEQAKRIGGDALGSASKGLGKVGDFMKGEGGKGIMTAVSVINDLQAMEHRKDAMSGIDDTLNKLEGAVNASTTNRIAGFEAAEQSYVQQKGLVGKQLGDRYKGAVSKTPASRTLASAGSIQKARKDARSMVANQGDQMMASLQNKLASSKGQVMTQTRGDRSKAQSAMADAKLQLKKLQKEQRMAPLKMASSVVGMVNPAAGMALNAGLSLYDAYS